MKELEIEHQYQLYLQRVDLDERRMPEVQKVETKRAFYAGFAQMLLLARDTISELDEDRAVLTLEDLLVQIDIFWQEQSRM